MPSFDQVLQRRVRADPGRPLVTFYDDATGERTELSVTTYANWVAKTAGVLVDDLDLQDGDRLRIDLPPHWLVPVFVGAASTVGLAVTDGEAEAVVGNHTDATLYCALLPFAVPARAGVPDGALDFGTLWPNQPDVYLGVVSAGDLPEVEPVTERLMTGDPEAFLGALVGGGSLVLVANPDPALMAARGQTERVTRTDL